jgi:hypothetical protein
MPEPKGDPYYIQPHPDPDAGKRCERRSPGPGDCEGQTPAAPPIDPARIVECLRETASCAVFDVRIDACNLAADLLETLADPRFGGIGCVTSLIDSADTWKAESRKMGYIRGEGADPFAALLALREALLAETAEPDTKD